MTVTLHRPMQSPYRSAGDRRSSTHLVTTLVVTGKLILLLLLLRVMADPAWANLEGKAPVARVVMFPLWAMAVPVFWATTRRAAPFPWSADVLVTLTCFTDILGNRLDLYDSIAWFDDGMHLMNTALVSAAFVVLTVERSAPLSEIVEAAVAFGMTASLGWELFEYATFLTRSTEWTSAYSDTMGDLSLGWMGSALAALVFTLARRRDVGRRRASSPGRAADR